MFAFLKMLLEGKFSSAFIKTIFVFFKMLLEGKFSFSENLPQYKYTLSQVQKSRHKSKYLGSVKRCPKSKVKEPEQWIFRLFVAERSKKCLKSMSSLGSL